MNQISTCPICNSANSSEFLKAKDYTVSKEIFTIVECTDCSFRYTNPIPSEENIGEYYKNEEYISHSGTKKGIVPKIYHQVRKITQKSKLKLITKNSEGKNLLDIGCGTGDFLNFMKQNNYETIGLEPDGEVRDLVKKNHGIDTFDITELHNLPDNSRDVITMWHVLEHVYHLQRDLKKIASVLKENGTLFVAVPNCDSHDAKKYKEFWAAYDLPIHLYHYRADNMRQLMEQHGLEVVKIKPMKFDSYYISLWSERNKDGNSSFSVKNLIKGFYNGFISNIKANNEGHSSSIYVIKKKK